MNCLSKSLHIKYVFLVKKKKWLPFTLIYTLHISDLEHLISVNKPLPATGIRRINEQLAETETLRGKLLPPENIRFFFINFSLVTFQVIGHDACS